MSYYVSFDDSESDPTYSNAESCYLVINDDPAHENPCVKAPIMVPVMPNSKQEIENFAYVMGWKTSYDQNGNVVLHTGISR